MSEELSGYPNKGKGFVVFVCTQEQKYRKNHEERVVRVMLRRFFRLSFTRGATGDRVRTLPVLGYFPLVNRQRGQRSCLM